MRKKKREIGVVDLLSNNEKSLIMEELSSFILIDIEDEPKPKHVMPNEVQSLINEFPRNLSNTLPISLSFQKTIQYEISFVLGSQLHHKQSYRMSSKENDELQKQVDKL